MVSATTSKPAPTRRRLRAAALFLAGALLPATVFADGGHDDAAGVEMGKEEALHEIAFPEADRIERRTFFLEPEQRQALSETARSEFRSRLVTVYFGYQGDALDGYAIIDTDMVRSKLATYIVALTPDGVVRNLRILAWQEPPEYQPPQRWLEQFVGSDGSEGLRIGRDIHAISGATLSARMFAEHVRRALAVHQVLLNGAEPAAQQ